jgi:hypothetical protein
MLPERRPARPSHRRAVAAIGSARVIDGATTRAAARRERSAGAVARVIARAAARRERGAGATNRAAATGICGAADVRMTGPRGAADVRPTRQHAWSQLYA